MKDKKAKKRAARPAVPRERNYFNGMERSKMRKQKTGDRA